METKTYPEMTEEQKEAIKALFDSYSSIEEINYTFETKEDGYYITVSQMYEYVEFKDGMSILVGFSKIGEILDCKEGDEIDRDSIGGCETCDWGSQYSYSLKFW